MTHLLENENTPRLSLNGKWHLALADQEGVVEVPGVWERQGFFLNAEGPAIYTRRQHIPADWNGAKIMLRFGAVSYYVEVRVNGQLAGAHEGLWTRFEFDVSALIRPGETNVFELRVIKPGDEGDTYPYREALVGFIPYVSLTFGGPWQGIELIAHTTPAWRDVRLNADWQTGHVSVSAFISASKAPDGITATAEIIDSQGTVVRRATQSVADDGQSVAFALNVANPALWSPIAPALYRLRLQLRHGSVVLTQIERRFGFRALHTDGERLLLNGQSIHLRGALSWGWNPDTLAPIPTDDEIRDEFRRVRELGFNLYKLCLYVPTPRLFEIADEEGMLIWLELPLWWQRLTEHLRQQAVVEYADILHAVHHHPSVVLVSLGCELGADMADADLLEQLSQLARATTHGCLLCDNSGSGEAFKGLGFDFADFTDYHFYCDLHDFVPLMDHFRRDWLTPRPWIFGEFCANEDYRDPAKLVNADGRRLWWRDLLGVGSTIDRWAYCEQEARIAAHHLPFTDVQLERIARRQSLVVRKFIIEQTRTRRDAGGYVVTALRDTPITTSGLFDDFNQHKFDPATFRAFNADTVLLLEQGRARVWMDGDRPAPLDRFNHRAGSTISLRLVLAHAGTDLPDAPLEWRLMTPDGATFASETITLRGPLVAGLPCQVARLEVALPADAAPGTWTLRASLGDIAANEWTLWVYPAAHPWPTGTAIYAPAGNLGSIDDLPRVADPSDSEGLLITSVWTPPVAEFVRTGGRALLLQTGPGALPARPAAFWQESIKLIYDHPIWTRFPHQPGVDLQFYHVASDHAFDTNRLIDSIPNLTAVRPVLRRLHARTFGVLDYLVDCEVGAGRLLASTLRFCGGAGDQVRGLHGNVAGDFLLREMAATIAAD